MITELLDSLSELEGLLRSHDAVNVNDSTTKQFAIDLAARYFQAYRPSIHQSLGDCDAVEDFDQDWQDLIRLAHGNNARKSYRALTRRLRKTTADINIAGLTQPPPAPVEEGHDGFSRSDRRLLETLEGYVPSAAASYKQGLLDLSSRTDRVSYRGTATEFRECMRETLHHLAPGEAVQAQEGFQFEQGLTKPTMKQRVRFVLSARGANQTRTRAAEKSVELVESLSGDITRAVYQRASLSTHVETTRQEVQQIKRYVATVLYDLLEIAE